MPHNPTKEDKMKRAHGNRVWRGMVLAAAIGAVAVLALSGLASARGGHHGGSDTGTISSFDSETGVLAIKLTSGDTVTGTVSRRTKIRCEDERSPDVSNRTTRFRESEPGDDHGDDGVEPGDDNGGGSGSGRGPSGHDDNGRGANCTVSDLVVGTAVHEAELDLRGGKAVWDEVELND
jgi:hypothetical protein